MSAAPGSDETEERRRRSAAASLYDTPESGIVTRTEAAAFALSLIWAAGLGAFLFFGPERSSESGGSMERLLVLIAFCLPIVLIWAAAATVRASLTMRDESRRLRASVDAMRKSYIAQNQKGATGTAADARAQRIEEIAASSRRMEALLARLSEERTQPPAPPPSVPTPAAPPERPDGADQPTLALGTNAEDLAPPLETADFITALNFPATADDARGFAALRRALRDRRSAQLVQAAQDVLTLLSQDGIYMDDLDPDRARPELWRQFGQGVRGRPIAALGGIHDRSALSKTLARMKQDPIFRDAAHHFLRIFDRTFAAFEQRASDSEIAALADTRTARAFMLLGRVAGTFD